MDSVSFACLDAEQGIYQSTYRHHRPSTPNRMGLSRMTVCLISGRSCLESCPAGQVLKRKSGDTFLQLLVPTREIAEQPVELLGAIQPVGPLLRSRSISPVRVELA